jgi:sugar phosphate isomerase/epimerase
MAGTIPPQGSPAPPHPDALRCLKGLFPFRLGTTSYIIPDAAIPNIRFLGPFVDEIELLLFESEGKHSLPSQAEIQDMRRLARDLGLVYNVHLPTDVFAGDPDQAKRRDFRETILRFMERTSPLDPTVYVLHCERREEDGRNPDNLRAWSDRVSESLEKIARSVADPKRIALENLEFPPEAVLPLAERFGMSLCLDIGHLQRYGHDLSKLPLYLKRSSMVHLHGVSDGRDHLGVHRIPEETWSPIRRALSNFAGGVSIEVFNLKELLPSLHMF